MKNVLCRASRSTQPFVATLVKTIFAQPSAEEVGAQLARVIDQLEGRFPGDGPLEVVHQLTGSGLSFFQCALDRCHRSIGVCIEETMSPFWMIDDFTV